VAEVLHEGRTKTKKNAKAQDIDWESLGPGGRTHGEGFFSPATDSFD